MTAQHSATAAPAATAVEAAARRRRLTVIFETTGSLTAMAYALLIAMNVGAEVLGFALLGLSALLFAIWAVIDRRWSFLALQGFYFTSAVVGIIRWG